MARESEISTSFKPLHNFALPDGLRWGNQKFLRCMKVNSNGKISAVVRRPSSSAASVSTRLSNNANRFPPSGLRKRKEVEEFIDQPQSPAPADDRRGSDFNKSGFNFKIPPAHYTEFGQKFKATKSGGGRKEDGIAAVREKLMFDIQTEADKMKDAILRDGFDTEDQVDDNNRTSPALPVSPVNTRPTVASPSDSIPPWNFRIRRAACKVPQPPNGAGTGGLDVGVQGLNSDAMIPDLKSSPVKPEENKAARPRSGGATPSIEKKERAKFSVALTKHEIEEDFLAFAGRRPPRRPHKRPKHVQKVLETLFPGLWLTEITADMYKVVEMP